MAVSTNGLRWLSSAVIIFDWIRHGDYIPLLSSSLETRCAQMQSGCAQDTDPARTPINLQHPESSSSSSSSSLTGSSSGSVCFSLHPKSRARPPLLSLLRTFSAYLSRSPRFDAMSGEVFRRSSFAPQITPRSPSPSALISKPTRDNPNSTEERLPPSPSPSAALPAWLTRLQARRGRD